MIIYWRTYDKLWYSIQHSAIRRENYTALNVGELKVKRRKYLWNVVRLMMDKEFGIKHH